MQANLDFISYALKIIELESFTSSPHVLQSLIQEYPSDSGNEETLFICQVQDQQQSTSLNSTRKDFFQICKSLPRLIIREWLISGVG